MIESSLVDFLLIVLYGELPVHGTKLMTGSLCLQMPGYEHGNFVHPTILAKVTQDMGCYKQEIFGPVLLCATVFRKLFSS